jgi:glycerol uptake facilitator-like aquaporin
MVMAVILFMGKVSGAHLNPAVSVAFSLRGDFPWRRVPGYIIAQLIGATLAALFLHAVINVSSTYGSNYPAAGYSAGSAFPSLAPRRQNSSSRQSGIYCLSPRDGHQLFICHQRRRF